MTFGAVGSAVVPRLQAVVPELLVDEAGTTRRRVGPDHRGAVATGLAARAKKNTCIPDVS